MESQALLYTDSETELTNDENEPPKKRSRSVGLEWQKTISYPNADEAITAIKSEGIWFMKRKSHTTEGEKVFYYCKYSKECLCKKYLLMCSDSDQVDVFETTTIHTHSESVNTRGLTREAKKKVKELLKVGVTKPKNIITKIREVDPTQEPTIKQLNNYLRCYRRKQGEPILSLGDLRKVLEDDLVIPEDIDTPFVCKSDIPDDDETTYFRFCYTTKRLQRFKEQGDTLHADATYKLLWFGFPVLLVGVSDKNRMFHPTCIAVCDSEATADFEFIFEAVRADNPSFTPSCIVADCADAITNAANKVFGDHKRIFCWAHVIRNVDKRLCTIKDALLRSKIREDILHLQLAQSDEEFDIAKNLWLKKWKLEESALSFVQYFEEEYLNNYVGWHVGRHLGSPCTNNGIESTNNVIKSHYTLRNRMAMQHFIRVLKTMVSDWSTERNPDIVNFKPFADKPSIGTKLWTDSYKWKRSKPNIRVRSDGSKKLYFIQSNRKLDLKDDDVKKHVRQFDLLNWRQFDTYVASRNRLWVVTIERNNWEQGQCTCPVFYKSYICKHIVGIAIIQNLCPDSVPSEAKSLPIEQKRKRGRPSKAKKALIRQ